MNTWADSEDCETGQPIQTTTMILPDHLLRLLSRFHPLRWDRQFQTHTTATHLQTKTSPRARATLQPARALQILCVSRKEGNEPFPTAAVRYHNFPTTMMNNQIRNQILPTLDNVQDLNAISPIRNPEIFHTVEDVPT